MSSTNTPDSSELLNEAYLQIMGLEEELRFWKTQYLEFLERWGTSEGPTLTPEQELKIQEAQNTIAKIPRNKLAVNTVSKQLTLRASLVDPYVNLEMSCLRDMMNEKEAYIKTLEAERQGFFFDPSTRTGVELVRKLAKLTQENFELGRCLREERFQDLRESILLEQHSHKELARETIRLTKELQSEKEKSAELASVLAANL